VEILDDALNALARVHLWKARVVGQRFPGGLAVEEMRLANGENMAVS
jgi:hypothetical protein